MVCTTGMAACTMVYLTYLQAGDHLILFHDTYGANYKVSLILERMNIEITWLDADEADRIGDHIRAHHTHDLPGDAEQSALQGHRHRGGAKRRRTPSGRCSSWTTPSPHRTTRSRLRSGRIWSSHSATKALGGHNDLMAGAIAGSKEHYNRLWFTRQAIGTTLDAYSAFLLARGLKTFELRAKAMANGAMKVAEFLAAIPRSAGSPTRAWRATPVTKRRPGRCSEGSAACWPSTSGEDEEDAKRVHRRPQHDLPRRQPRGDGVGSSASRT